MWLVALARQQVGDLFVGASPVVYPLKANKTAAAPSGSITSQPSTRLYPCGKCGALLKPWSLVPLPLAHLRA